MVPDSMPKTLQMYSDSNTAVLYYIEQFNFKAVEQLLHNRIKTAPSKTEKAESYYDLSVINKIQVNRQKTEFYFLKAKKLNENIELKNPLFI